ncbi:MAG: polyhydroxyalkanoate synthesis repressor PhaR [Blastomonas sp. CACIA14H2]|jgi:polyhydroxyalkanoate synthesis repressor PhaR|uniref:polyhydroxyalkanoate synthesis repressor PhaR n=1 Tax=unclassified Blastomonas TaxID=2626550 RepID=UPI0003CFA32C|nr:MAG: polyhydroxyalkanoate synthesis repressor PhaR [Blastomonas sp. CACIA14H2]MBL0966614.1 polyhydroxyalkanoate synthesis repressor PhaR [Blastomonas sp.]
MAKSGTSDSDDVIIIKKYANRRLYNTRSSSYITLDYLAKLTREGKDFQVVDAKTGDDITHNILTQIIMEEESSGQQMLPVGFLRELISMYGNSMQSMIPQYLEASMEAFRKNQEKFQSAMEGSIKNSPFAQLARQNLAMFEAASSAFSPRKDKPASPAQPVAASSDDEIAALKAQLSAMQRKIDDLVDKK